MNYKDTRAKLNKVKLNFFHIILILCLTFLISSCKKEACVYCEFSCYYFWRANTEICTDYFVSVSAFNHYKDSLLMIGDSCSQTHDRVYSGYSFCGTERNADAYLNVRSSNGFNCHRINN